MESFSPSTANGLVFALGASGFSAVGQPVDAVARFGRGGRLRKTNFFLRNRKGCAVTHSLVNGILMECRLHEYRCRAVDANVIRVLPREVAQAVMVPTTLVLQSLVRDVGKELPRVEPVVFMSFRVD